MQTDTPPPAKTMWLWLAWVVPSSMPVSILCAQRFGVFDAVRAHLPTGPFFIALNLAPLAWLALTAAASVWLARDICHENYPGRKDGCAVLAVAFGIFCFQAIFAWGITLVSMSMLGE